MNTQAKIRTNPKTQKNRPASRAKGAADKQHLAGLSRDELRQIVIEMIG